VNFLISSVAGRYGWIQSVNGSTAFAETAKKRKID